MKAIKQQGGITFAQDERSAAYFGMPQSSITAGVVDFVLPPEEIAKRLAEIGRHAYVRTDGPLKAAEPPSTNPKSDHLNEIFRLLQRTFGVDFTTYKLSTISRRIHRRMALTVFDRPDRGVSAVRSGTSGGVARSVSGYVHRRHQLFPGSPGFRGSPEGGIS